MLSQPRVRSRAGHVLGKEEHSSRSQNTMDLRHSIRLRPKASVSVAEGAECRLEYDHVETVVKVRDAAHIHDLIRNRVLNPVVAVKPLRLFGRTVHVTADDAASRARQKQREAAVTGAEFEGKTSAEASRSFQPEVQGRPPRCNVPLDDVSGDPAVQSKSSAFAPQSSFKDDILVRRYQVGDAGRDERRKDLDS